MISTDDSRKLGLVKIDNDSERLFNLDQIKPYLVPVQHAEKLFSKISIAFEWFESALTNNVFMTEVLDESEKGCRYSTMSSAIQSKIDGRFKRGIFKVILKEVIHVNGNVLSGRFVLLIK